MLKNYLITAFRNLIREKGSAFINIAGLTLGITCSLVLFLLVKHLASFDKFNSHYDNIYRIVTESDGNDGRFYTAGVPSVFPEAFKQDFPEAKEVTFTSYRANAMVTIPQDEGEPKKYSEESGVVFAEPNFFKIFDRKILIGDAAKGLDEPGEAIISKASALKYFGKEDAIGEVVKFDTLEFKITAVMEDYPVNTDFPFDLMLSYESIRKPSTPSAWNSIWSDEQCYILLQENERTASIMQRMPAFVEKYLGKDNYSHQTFVLQPLSELHFDDRYSTYSYKTTPREILIALSVIALFLIITACINFVNLTTAEAIKRSKEVGIRKSLGSNRSQLIFQFLGETTLVTAFAMLMSLGLTQLALNILNPLLEVKLGLHFFSDVLLWYFVVGVTVVVALLSGLYPSLVLSGFKPASALKNQVSLRSSSGFNLRRGLVILQFVISQFFIMSTIVLIKQMNYFQKKELGFRKDAVLLVPIPQSETPGGSSKMKTLRDELSKQTGIDIASLSSTPPSSGSVNGTNFRLEGESQEQSKGTQIKQVDGHYIPLYNLELIAGNNIEDEDTAKGFVVNEEFARISGFNDPQEIIGKRVLVWGKNLPVVGVVKNFHTVSLHAKIEPTLLMNRIRGYETLSLKVNQAQLKEVIDVLKSKWEAAYPEHIFSYDFLDERIMQFYEGEQKMSVLLSVFTSIAIFIGCLGLFGLATFMTNQKTKEIGVRKAMGASVESIVYLFSKEYVRLIIIGFILASPAAWLLMNEWLDQFAYKITIGPVVFIAALIVTLLIAVFTVGYKSFKAAIVNPIKSLRYE